MSRHANIVYDEVPAGAPLSGASRPVVRLGTQIGAESTTTTTSSVPSYASVPRASPLRASKRPLDDVDDDYDEYEEKPLFETKRVAEAPRPFSERQIDLFGPKWLSREAVALVGMQTVPLYAFARLVAGKTNVAVKTLTQPLDDGLARYVESQGATLDSFLEELGKASDQDDTVAQPVQAAQAAQPAQAAQAAQPAQAAQAAQPAQAAQAVQAPQAAQAPAMHPVVTQTQSRESRQHGTIALALWKGGALSKPIVESALLLVNWQRERTRDVFAWMQMPQHLGTILFSEVLQAAFEAAYADVTEMAQRDEFTFSDLVATSSPLRDRFASLVATHIKIARSDMPTRYMRAGARAIYVKERASLVRYFRGLPRPYPGFGGGREPDAQRYGGRGLDRGELAGFEALYKD